MPQDYPAATWLPCKNFWPGGNSMARIVIHGTASGGPQTGYQLATGSEFNDGRSASVTYINDTDGTVYQVVQESDSHWGNCCVYGTEAPPGYYPLPGTGNYHLRGLVTTGTPGAVNMNHATIAIENVKHSTDNSEALAPAQYQSLVTLVADIATRRKIPPVRDRIIGHFDLDAVNKARCPGTFDWSSFYRDVQVAMGYGPLPRVTLAGFALAAGFTGTNADIAVAVSLAESGGMPLRQGLVPDGSLDRGVLQFNSHWHAEVTDASAYDPGAAFKEMFRVTAGGNFAAWKTYTSGAYQQFMPGGSVLLNNKGMVADILQTNQLSENEMDLCGPWAVAALLYAGAPTKGPTGTAEQIDQWVDAAVGVMGYPNPADFPGVSVANEEWLLARSGLHYQEVSPDVGTIRRAVQAGYPVIITAYEPNISAWSFTQNAWVPAYTWSINANHVLPVGGLDQNGNLICADQLNNAFQGYWPPIYNAGRIAPSYAAVVRLPFLAAFPSANPSDAVWTGFNAQQGGTSMPVPANWKDDGTTLIAPNGKHVVFGFRAHVLSAPTWDTNNQPIENEQGLAFVEESNHGLGAGSRQIFIFGDMLEYTAARGVYTGWLGQEFGVVRADRDAKALALSTSTAQLGTARAALDAANAQIATLLAQLAAIPPPVPVVPPPDLSAVKADLTAAAGNLAAALAALPS